MSFLRARNALADFFGQFFGGNRDVYTAFGYHKGQIDYKQCIEKYRRQGITSRIVNAYPDAVWSRPPRIVGNDDLQKAITTRGLDEDEQRNTPPGIAERLGLWTVLNRAERLAGLGRYSVILLGFDDVRRNTDMAKPVRLGSSLLYLQAYGEGEVTIRSITQDAANPNFGRPEFYRIQSNIAEGDARLTESYEVHHSRVLHVVDQVLDSEIFGYPIIHRVFNELDDLLKTSGAAAEMMYLSARKGMQINVDKDMQFTQEDAENLRAEVDEYINNISRIIRTRGVDIKNLGADDINPEPVYNIILSQISTTTGIPQRIFIGSEQGKLASEQDRANWAARVEDRRATMSEPHILRPLIDRLQAIGALPVGPYDIRWPDAFRLSPLETAQTAAQQARSAVNIARAVREVPELLNKREARAVVLATGELDAIRNRDDDEEFFKFPEDVADEEAEPVEDEDENEDEEGGSERPEDPDEEQRE